MFITGVKDRWHASYAERLLREAIRDFEAPKPRLSSRLVLGIILAALIISTPFLVLCSGLALIIAQKASLLSLVLGGILLGFGYILLPTRRRNTRTTYTRHDFPHLFALLDNLAARMGAHAPTGVHLDNEMNAYMTRFKPFLKQEEWVLGIGMALWTTASEEERLALLAHELAHMINNDPQRHGLYHDAEAVLVSWHDTLTADAGDGFGGADFIQMFAAGFVRYLYTLLNFFAFTESQRAEYRADAIAAQAAGRSATLSLLETFAICKLESRAILDLYPYASDQNGRIFDHIAQTIRAADPDEVTRIMGETRAEKRRVDESHPPTAMRMEFISSLPSDADARKLDSGTVDFKSIDHELAGMKHELGRRWMEDLHAMETDR